MKKMCQRRIVAVSIFLSLAAFFVVGPRAEAYSLNFHPLTLLEQAAGIIAGRVADIVTYLVRQKEYIFNDYSDPNDLLSADLTVSAEVENILSATSSTAGVASAKTVTVPPVGKLVVVTTSTIPEVKTAPAPVQTKTDSDSQEILRLTNKERKAGSLDSLSDNSLLDKIASERIDDMFANQYFEHESPDNRSVSDLAKKDGYEYLLIGENLALGAFDGNAGLVEAWMNSPGHRANILNGKFTELGVAVRTDYFNGEKELMAVQVFGRPSSICAKPKSGDLTLVNEGSDSVKKMQAEAQVMYGNLTALKNNPDIDRAYYLQKVQEYNYYAAKVNAAISALKGLIDNYNAAVGVYNSCLDASKK